MGHYTLYLPTKPRKSLKNETFYSHIQPNHQPAVFFMDISVSKSYKLDPFINVCAPRLTHSQKNPPKMVTKCIIACLKRFPKNRDYFQLCVLPHLVLRCIFMAAERRYQAPTQTIGWFRSLHGRQRMCPLSQHITISCNIHNTINLLSNKHKGE